MRALVADLGDAYCDELRRTGIGPFEVADADAERVIPLNDALGFLPCVTLSGEEARRAGHGVAVVGPEGVASPGGAPAVRLLDADGLIAIAEPRQDGLLKPVVGFRA